MSRESLGHFELLVLLATLRVSGDGTDAYGVSIAREFERHAGRGVLHGSVYAALDRLEAKGLLTSWRGEATPARGGRAKKHFAVTVKGLRDARRAQRTLVSMWNGLPQLTGGRT